VRIKERRGKERRGRGEGMKTIARNCKTPANEGAGKRRGRLTAVRLGGAEKTRGKGGVDQEAKSP